MKALNLKEIVIKYAGVLKHMLDEVLLDMIESYVASDNPGAVWKLVEYSRYRSHVMAARARAEERFENFESKETCGQYEEMVKELAERRISYSLFEEDVGVYPRIHINSGNIECEEGDTLWFEICFKMLQYPPVKEKPLRSYYRQALFDLVKN